MQNKLLSDRGGKAHALVFETGDEVMSLLTRFAEERQIRAARFTGLGAFRSARLAYFDWETKKYEPIPIQVQAEVLVLTGDIALKDGKPVAHAHCVLGLRDGSTRGGHLMHAEVRPTLEVTLVEAGALERKMDPESGIALIDPAT